jgi:hypothetical protein
MKGLEELLAPHKYEFYRGDSFQVYLRSAEEGLRLLLQLRCAALRMPGSTPDSQSDIRASIGIGHVKAPVKTLQTATDEAFILSGRSFDKMKEDERLLISCAEPHKAIQTGLNVVAHFVEYIFHRLTTKQAAVVYELLLNRTQVETAKRLKKSQATVHKHTQSAGWPHIEKLLKEYQALTGLIEP